MAFLLVFVKHFNIQAQRMLRVTEFSCLSLSMHERIANKNYELIKNVLF